MSVWFIIISLLFLVGGWVGDWVLERKNEINAILNSVEAGVELGKSDGKTWDFHTFIDFAKIKKCFITGIFKLLCEEDWFSQR